MKPTVRNIWIVGSFSFRPYSLAQKSAAKYGPDYLNNSENRNSLYQQLGGKAKEILSTIERSNARNGTSGLSQGDQSKLLLAVENGSVTERELAIICKLLGY